LIARVVTWASSRDDIHAVALVGSRARGDADEYSDHDFVLVVDDPEPYLRSVEWVRAIGEPLASFAEPAATGGIDERRVLFADGADADFSLLPVERVAEVLGREDVAPVLARGVRVLLDKRGLADAFAPRPVPAASEDVDALANEFWYRALLTTRKLRRGEIYVAVQGCNCGLRPLLERAIARQSDDAWHAGRFFERWADPELARRFAATVATHETVADAIAAACDLFAELTPSAPVDVPAIRAYISSAS
jgi:aminoglycoside 6-adenylyltransferase